MERVIDVAERPPSAHWVTAYAMGLVATSRATAELVERLVESCGGDAATLCEARRELYRLEIFDEDLRRRAGELLWLAAEAAGEGVSVEAVAGQAGVG